MWLNLLLKKATVCGKIIMYNCEDYRGCRVVSNDITISASVVTYNCKEKAVKTVCSLLENTNKYPLCLTVYDNASSDGTAEAIAQIDGVNLVQTGENLGFGKAHNLALYNNLGKYHAVINPDIIVSSDILAELADILEQNPDIAMITPQILNSDGTVQNLQKREVKAKYLFLGRFAKFGGIFKKMRDEYTSYELDSNGFADIDFCTGCFFLIRSDIFLGLGGFDERFFMYMEDADLSKRVKKKGRIVYCPAFSVTHLWERESAKNIKYLLIHFLSFFKYLAKWRKEKTK